MLGNPLNIQPGNILGGSPEPGEEERKLVVAVFVLAGLRLQNSDAETTLNPKP